MEGSICLRFVTDALGMIGNSSTVNEYIEAGNNTQARFPYCDMTIRVVDKISDGKPVYDLSYKYTYGWFIGEHIETVIYVGETDSEIFDQHKTVPLKYLKCNPFYMNDREKEFRGEYGNIKMGADGEIIAKNEMTSSLMRYLLMPMEEMRREETGHSDALYYKLSIIRMITMLWD